MRVLVTGGAGFIGSHLADALAADSHQVVVLDDLSSGSLRNLEASRELITFVRGDVRDDGLLARVVAGTDMVFHLAANASVPASVEDPSLDFETNALGTQRLLLACHRAGVRRVILGSSAAVYGAAVRTPIRETDPTIPISPYGASKLSAESVALAYRHSLGVDTVICRIFNTYGPRQRRYVMHDLYRKLRASPGQLRVRGDGKQVRDYLFISDAIRALRLVAARGDGVYNVAAGVARTIREVAETMVGLVSPGAAIRYGDDVWPGDIAILHADIARLTALGFVPEVDLATGLKRLIQEHRECL